jgi:hypothetical protein
MLGHSIVSQHFMEPVGSIPNSQELSTSPQTNPISLTQNIIVVYTFLNMRLMN